MSKTEQYRICNKNCLVNPHVFFLPPVAPVISYVLPGNATIDISWNIPYSYGTPLSQFILTVEGTPASTIQLDPRITSLNINGLVNGNTYHISIIAVDQYGQSPSSNIVASIPYTIPNPPINVLAIPQNTRILVYWADDFDGGSPITGYIMTVSGPTSIQRFLYPAGTHFAEIDSLLNEYTYTVQIVSTNRAGNSQPSFSVSVVPVTVPNQPVLLSAIPGNKHVVLSWSNPDPSANVFEYIVDISLNGTPILPFLVNAPATFLDVSNLTNGQTYDFSVISVNSIGNSLPSNDLSAVPYTIPQPPTIASVVAGNANIDISWNPPTDNGGAALLGYQLSVYYNQALIETINTPPTITHVDISNTTVVTINNGNTYTLSVASYNKAGLSTIVSATSTPYTVPLPPTNITANYRNQGIFVLWNAPLSTGGSPIIRYIIYLFMNGINIMGIQIADPTVRQFFISNITNNPNYTVSMVAANIAGDSYETNKYQVT